MFFGTSYNNTDHPDQETVYGSIAAYWDQMGGSKINLKSGAVGSGPSGGVLNTCDGNDKPNWIALSGTKESYHDASTKGTFRSAAETAANNAGIDINDSSTYRLAYIYAGNLYDSNWPGGCGIGTSGDPDDTGCGLTPHAILGGSVYIYPELRDSNHTTDARNCEGTGCATTPVFAHIGSHVHEIGHMLGLEHPHDGGNPNDVYFWSPLQSGDKSGPTIGSSPIKLTPEEMVDLGFAAFTSITGRTDDLMVREGTYYRMNYGGAGHFIFEHRNSGGAFNNYLWKNLWTGKGLLLWYTDDIASFGPTANQCLIAADGDPIHTNTMANDVFPGPLNKTSIADNTTVEVSNEATGITNGTDTRVALVNIQAVVDSTEVDVFDQNHYYLHTGKAVNIMKAEARKVKIDVGWNLFPVTTTYYLYYGTEPKTYDNLMTVASSSSSKLVTSLINDDQYYFKVNSSSEFTNIPSDCRSDFDGDDDIDFDDFFDFADVFGKEEGDTGYAQKFDLQGNREVDYPDTVFFYSDFGEDCVDTPN